MMRKFLVIVLILGAVFWAGYYAGQQPEKVKKQLRELSQEVLEQTIGREEGEQLFQENFLQAQSRFLDGKAKILDGKPDEAIAELEETIDYLKEAAKMQGADTSEALLETMLKIGDLRQSLADGQAVSQEALEEVQAKLEALLL